MWGLLRLNLTIQPPSCVSRPEWLLALESTLNSNSFWSLTLPPHPCVPLIVLSFMFNTQPGFYHMTLPPPFNYWSPVSTLAVLPHSNPASGPLSQVQAVHGVWLALQHLPPIFRLHRSPSDASKVNKYFLSLYSAWCTETQHVCLQSLNVTWFPYRDSVSAIHQEAPVDRLQLTSCHEKPLSEGDIFQYVE